MATELVVISGKGGTGKTSLVASLAVLAGEPVLADCDVDAADLHLVLRPAVERSEPFSGGSQAKVIAGRCTACGKCHEVCRFAAVTFDGPANESQSRTFRVDPIACEGCGVCERFCPAGAIAFEPAVNGEWYVSRTRCGPMVHARLGVAQENSGKLVTLVRNEAKRIADRRRAPLLLVDGSPGIGCPVIASVAGTDLALIVSEPTLSGLHDLERVAALTARFQVETLVCVNKWDLNAEMTERIEARAREGGLAVIGRIRYDRAVTDAQVNGQAVVEHAASGAAEDIRRLWDDLKRRLERHAA